MGKCFFGKFYNNLDYMQISTHTYIHTMQHIRTRYVSKLNRTTFRNKKKKKKEKHFNKNHVPGNLEINK